jgi:hypothetical protein
MGATPQEIRRYQPILTAQIGAESNFTQGVGSPAGARDIAQFMPGTAPGYGVKLGDNRIKDDIRGQVRYMLPLLREHGVEGALRGYNAGIGAIERSKGFSETNNYVRRVRSTAGQYRGAGGTPEPSSPTAPAPEYGAPDGQARQQALIGYLGERGKPGALLQLKAGLDQADAAPAPTAPNVRGTPAPAQPGKVADIKAEAALIDSARVPYQWGGGHQKKLIRGSKVTPLDCSGAVSRVLGIDPRVSGQFESWGKAGPGKRVTIYANDTHVLMKIGKRFFGTSSSNPGGGAGWIDAKHISKAYLARFVARHPPGL